jgi:RimJ/RimL family protein N-acetyltransferase
VVAIIRASERDLTFIMATERLHGYDSIVGRWDEARHRVALSDGKHAYFLARDGVEHVGFAILRDWASPERLTLLKRIVVVTPGRGYGQAFLRALVNAVFLDTDAHRLLLGVFPDNVRRVAPMKLPD